MTAQDVLGLEILGLEVPDTRLLFLVALSVHVLAASFSVILGAFAATARKRPGRHPKAGRLYVFGMATVFASATVMSVMRWHENWHLFIIATCAFGLALLGLLTREHEWTRRWMALHGTAMSVSYILLYTGFYVDNGPQLPVWDQLPRPLHWLIPSLIGVPLLIRALIRNRAFAPRRSPRTATGETTTDQRR